MTTNNPRDDATLASRETDPWRESRNLTSRAWARSARRRWPIIVLCTLISAAGAFVLAHGARKQYTATASILFSNSQLGAEIAGFQAASSSDQQVQQDTNVAIVKLAAAGRVSETTARIVGHGITADRVRAALSLGQSGDTEIVSVAATYPDPRLAASIANVFSRQFIASENAQSEHYYSAAVNLITNELSALTPAQRSGTQGQALNDRLESLSVLAQLQTQNTQIESAASVPTSPSSPKVATDTAIALILGLLFGCALVGLLELADHSVGSPAELEEVFRAPLLGVIPEDSALAAPFRTASGRGLIDADEEVFHLLRAHLRYFNLDRELRSILVCSSGPGEGKTTVAAHLASAMAAGGARVLLVEADLRLPVMSARLNIRQAPGLADVVVGRVGLQDAVQTVPVPGDEGGLCVLVAGAMPPNPTQMLESEAMARVLAEASNDFDMVIVDSAPLLSVADTIGLLKRVDGVIVVTMLGKSRSDVASRTAAMLRRVGAPLLGVVANGVRGAELAPYRYGYSYGPRARAAAGPVSGTLAELDRERGNPRA